MSITVSIVEDNKGTREVLQSLLAEASGIQCKAAYATGEDAVRDLPRDPPDVALVDINLPGMDGIQCVIKLRAALPKLRVLMLTRYEESDMIFNALRAGASGYLLKKTIPVELAPAIEQVHSGGAPMSMQIARQVVHFFHRSPETTSEVETLTAREQEILVQLSKGFLYKEIADSLGISLDTVRVHVKHIYEKLHVRSRTEATLKYLERGQK
jgi:DNA-binding NarL/FixJ family response regulator